MKKRWISGIITGVFLLLTGCSTDIDNMDISPQKVQSKDRMAESALISDGSGEDIAQTAEDEPKAAASDITEALLPAVSYTTAYRRFLEAYVKESRYAHMARVMLALIDDDNVPELLLIEDNSHSAGVKVYTYYQGSVIELGEFGSIGYMHYVERGGMIHSGFAGMGECDTAFYHVEDGEAKLVCSMMEGQPLEGSPFYEIDGVRVTEEAYDKKWEELYDAYEYIGIGYDDALAIWDSELTDLLEEAKDALLLQRGSPRLAEMVAEQSAVLEGYRAFLAEYVSNRTGDDSEEVPGCALIYLNDDDVPELIVMEGYAHTCGASVYTFEEGEVIPIGEYGQYGTMLYREKEGIVFDDYDTEVSEEQYREVCDKWNENGYRVVDCSMCQTLTDVNIQRTLTEELENLILTQKEVLKQNVLIAAGAQESKILLFDYDDYDSDGKCEVFMICGDSYDELGTVKYRGVLYFAGADCCTLLRDQHYRMIDGKMKFGSDRKYLFFYTDYNFTANISELWTVEDGTPIESEFSQIGQVVYRGGNDFEIWMDTYDHFYGTVDDLWWGHTYKPYFYFYNYSSNRIEAYGGAFISGEAFAELSGTNLIEEIEAEGYTVEAIIQWENDIVTINYVIPADENDSLGNITYENVIWDNRVKDFWEKDVRGVTSWENAGEGGSFRM